MGFEVPYEHLSDGSEATNREVILKIKPAISSLIGIVFFERLSHPDKYSSALHTEPSETY